MALKRMGPPLGTEDLAALASSCDEGQTQLLPDTSPAMPGMRLFSTWEITRYLIPVAPGHFRRVLKQNPNLPQGRSESDGAAKWFSAQDVLELKAHFAAQGARGKQYLPYRPAECDARVIALAQAQTGSGKTTTATHLAMAAALDGYRVLVIDLDPQATLSRVFGSVVRDVQGTVLPMVARHLARYQQSANQRRLDRGEAPLPLDETASQALTLAASDLVQDTPWPNIDLIPADLSLVRADMQIPSWQMAARGWRPWEAVAGSLAADGLLTRYDIVVLDTGPSLGPLTLAALAAADILLVPLRADAADFEGTARFLSALSDTFSMIETAETQAAQALGRSGPQFRWDAVRAVLTQYEETAQAEMAAAIQGCLGPALLPHRQAFASWIGPGTAQSRTVYETDYRDVGREAFVRTRDSFDAVYAGVKELIIGGWRRAEMG